MFLFLNDGVIVDNSFRSREKKTIVPRNAAQLYDSTLVYDSKVLRGNIVNLAFRSVRKGHLKLRLQSLKLVSNRFTFLYIYIYVSYIYIN